jgi:hypothetical protein
MKFVVCQQWSLIFEDSNNPTLQQPSETGCPRNAAIFCHPFSTSGSASGFFRFGTAGTMLARALGLQAGWAILESMDIERIIDDIEQLEEMFEAPDIRPFNASDISAANRRHDERLAHSPWFKLWQQYGVCCRPESPVFRLGAIAS